MTKKVTTKKRKSTVAKTTKSKSSKSASKTTNTTKALNQKSPAKKYTVRSSVTGKFVSAKSGRIVKSSPAKPRLGRERIQTAVRNYVRREA